MKTIKKDVIKMIEELRNMPEVSYVSTVLPDPYGFTTITNGMEYDGRTVNGMQIELSDDGFDLFDTRQTTFLEVFAFYTLNVIVSNYHPCIVWNISKRCSQDNCVTNKEAIKHAEY